MIYYPEGYYLEARDRTSSFYSDIGFRAYSSVDLAVV